MTVPCIHMKKIIWTLYFLFYVPGQLKSGHEASAQGGSSAAASTSLQQTTDRQLSRLLYKYHCIGILVYC